MSILGAMYAAVSGLNAQSDAMGHISDNLANSQTTGYKKVDTRFANLVTVSNKAISLPGSVVTTPFYANALQGSITQNQDHTNLALSGNGFFVVSKPTQQTATGTSFNALNYYTRAGDFDVNRDGYLVNSEGYYLDGWPVDQTTGSPNTAQLGPIQITQLIDQPTATSEIDFVGNLPANSKVNPTPPLAPTNLQVFDALGNSHTVNLAWTKRADNSWKLDIQAPDSTLDPVGGTITGVNDQAMAVTHPTANVPAGAQVDTVTMTAMTPGQTATYSIGATPIVITAPAGGFTAAQAASALAAAINADPALSAQVTAGNVNATPGQFTVTSDTPGTAFTAVVGGTAAPADATTTPNVAPVAQVDNVTLTGTVSPNEIGDSWSITVGTAKVTYVNNGNETSLTDVANGLAALVNANPSLGVTATVTPPGTISLTANKPGTSFSSAVASANGATPGFIDVDFGTSAATAGKLVAITNAFNPGGNAQIPPLQGANDPAVISFQVDYGTGPQTVKLNLGQFQSLSGLTQFDAGGSGNPTISVQRLTQDGVPQGLLKDVNIGTDGSVQVSYDNGRTKTFFKVPVAQFSDVSSLKREDGQAFTETFDSGSPRVSAAGDNGSGTIRGSALEGSNVDIAEEFSNMIITQRSFAANTRVITTADEMLQDVIAIKR